MDIHNHNLNIHYSIPESLWNELVEMFAQLPHYRGFSDGCPQWYGYDGKLIEASLEASGLQSFLKRNGMGGLRSFSAEQRKSWDIP